MALQRLLDGIGEVCARPFLHDVPVCTVAKRLINVGRRGITAQHNDADVRLSVANCPRSRKAAHARHGNIEDYHVRLKIARECNSGFPVGSLPDHLARISEYPMGGVPNQGVVISQDDARNG